MTLALSAHVKAAAATGTGVDTPGRLVDLIQGLGQLGDLTEIKPKLV
jgi:hypothetical protein